MSNSWRLIKACGIYIYILYIAPSHFWLKDLAQGFDMIEALITPEFYFAPYKQSPDNCQLACVAPAVLPTIDAESLTIVKAFLALPEPRCVVCGEHDWLRCFFCDKLLRCNKHACLRANTDRYPGDWNTAHSTFLHLADACMPCTLADLEEDQRRLAAGMYARA